jgi:hypothetical protein
MAGCTKMNLGNFARRDENGSDLLQTATRLSAEPGGANDAETIEKGFGPDADSLSAWVPRGQE